MCGAPQTVIPAGAGEGITPMADSVLPRLAKELHVVSQPGTPQAWGGIPGGEALEAAPFASSGRSSHSQSDPQVLLGSRLLGGIVDTQGGPLRLVGMFLCPPAPGDKGHLEVRAPCFRSGHQSVSG